LGLLSPELAVRTASLFLKQEAPFPGGFNGLSLFISYFSAGTFVVWGSIAYQHGLVANTIQLTMAISGALVALFIAQKWKKTGAQNSC